MDEMEHSCHFGAGYLEKKPVKSNGLSKLVEATSDMSSCDKSQQKQAMSGMEPPKAKDTSRD